MFSGIDAATVRLPWRRVLGMGGALALVAPMALAQVAAPEGQTAIAVDRFTGSGDAEAEEFGPALGELLVNDTLQLLQAGGRHAGCPVVLVEWLRRAELEAEIALQQSELFDPATRVEPGHLIDPSILIGGHVRVEGGSAAFAVQVRSHPDGTVLREITGEVPEAELLDLGSRIGAEILDELCPKGWTASGGTVGGAGVTIVGTVAALDKPFTLSGTFPGGQAEFTYAPSGPGGGSFRYAAAGSGVTGSGEGTYTAETAADGTVLLRQTGSGCVDGVPGSCRTTTEEITLTPLAE